MVTFSCTAAAKLRPAAAEGGAGSHSRLQRCMRRCRSLQQRMQQLLLQQSEAVKQEAEQQEEQQTLEQPRYHLLCSANHRPAGPACWGSVLPPTVRIRVELLDLFSISVTRYLRHNV